MEYGDIVKEILNGLTGNTSKDMIYLREQTVKYKEHKNNNEIARLIGQLTLEVLSNKDKISDIELQRRTTLINNNYDEAIKLLEEDRIIEAKELLEQAIDIIPYKDKAGKTMFSFKSAVELWIYMMMFNPEHEMIETTTDNSSIFSLYGYIQSRMLNMKVALKSYENSLRWNPVNVKTIIEIAEINKMNWNHNDYINLMKNALLLSKSSEELASCYYSLAKYYSGLKDYNTSVCLYYISNTYKENKSIYSELTNLNINLGVNIETPSMLETKEILRKIDIQLGPSDLVLNAVRSLAKEAKNNNSLPIYKYCKEVYSELTGRELV